MEVWRCIGRYTLVSVASFFVGRLVFSVGERVAPGRFFDPDRHPYRAARLEREGRVYERVGVHRWKARVPDMSRLLPALIPSKRPPERPDLPTVERMLRETCVAEWTHGVLAFIGLAGILFGGGPVRRVLGGLYTLGNLPFILIQRYNRPRLLRLRDRLRRRTPPHTHSPACGEEGDLCTYGESHAP